MCIRDSVEWSNSKSAISGSWTAFKDLSGIDYYEVSLGSAANNSDVVNWRNAERDTSYDFTELNLQDGQAYFINVKATDLLGNTSGIASSDGFTVDVNQPQVSSISIAPNSTVPIFNDLIIKYTLSEPVTEAFVEFSSQLGDSPQYSFTLTDSTEISVNVKAPFVSGDEFTFTVQDFIDRAGNPGISNNYIYSVGYLADYDLDGSIGVSDYNTFVTGWSNKDIAYELGPVSGSAPYLKPGLDGVYDSQDGMSFYYMWHWDHDQHGN